MNTRSVQSLSNEELLHDLERTAANERNATVDLIVLLAEMDARRLYLQQGYSSLFVYCTRHLHLSEHAAYGRIEAARAARKFPTILDRLADGSITLTAICLLSNYLSTENHHQLLNDARHKTRREVEHQVAALHPMPIVPSSVRKLPERRVVTENAANQMARKIVAQETTTPHAVSREPESAPSRPPVPPVVRPLAPERYKVQFTIGPETHQKLRAVQDLLRHVVPNGDLATILDRALTLLLRDLERRKFGQVARPRPSSVANSGGRHVPAAVKRSVWARDKGRCAFVGTKGRCQERGFLEFHHVIPFADGGATTVENIQLRCRAHNQHEAREHFSHLPLA